MVRPSWLETLTCRCNRLLQHREFGSCNIPLWQLLQLHEERIDWSPIKRFKCQQRQYGDGTGNSRMLLSRLTWMAKLTELPKLSTSWIAYCSSHKNNWFFAASLRPRDASSWMAICVHIKIWGVWTIIPRRQSHPRYLPRTVPMVRVRAWTRDLHSASPELFTANRA